MDMDQMASAYTDQLGRAGLGLSELKKIEAEIIQIDFPPLSRTMLDALLKVSKLNKGI